MKLLAQSALFVAFLSLSMGLSTLVRARANALSRAFFVGSLGVCFWAISFFLSFLLNSVFFSSLHALSNTFLPILVIPFIQKFFEVEERKSSKIFLWAARTVAVLAVLGYQPSPLMMLNGVKGYFYTFSTAIIFLQVVWLIVKESTLRPTVGIVYPRSFSILALFVLLTCNMNHIQGIPYSISVFGNLALLVLLYFFSQAILNKRTLSLYMFLERVLVMTIIGILLTGVFSMIFTYAEGDLGIKFLNAALVSVLLLNLFESIRTYFARLLRWIGIEPDTRWLDTINRTKTKLDASTSEHEVRFYVLELIKTRVTAQSVHYVHSHGVSSDALSPSDSLVYEGLNFAVYESPEPQHRLILIWMEAVSQNVNISPTSGEHQSELKMISLRLEHPVFSPQWHQGLGPLNELAVLGPSMFAALRRSHISDHKQNIAEQSKLSYMSQGLAHELRNPLATIQMACESLTLNPRAETLNLMGEEVKRLDRLVSAFQKYATPFHLESLSVICLGDCVGAWVRRFMASGGGLTIVFDEKNPKFMHKILSSEDIMSQILTNLAENALRAYKQHDISVERRIFIIELGDFAHGGVTVQVKDMAYGMSAGQLARAPIPFVSHFKEGTGLGLSLVARMMEASLGSMEIASHEGEGTTVTLRFRAGVELEGVRSWDHLES